MARQFWSIEGRQYPSEPIRSERVHEVFATPRSLHYICPISGRIWASRTVIREDGGVQPWSVIMVPERGNPSPVPLFPAGCLCTAFSDLTNYPTFVLEREFLLLCDALRLDDLLDKLADSAYANNTNNATHEREVTP